MVSPVDKAARSVSRLETLPHAARFSKIVAFCVNALKQLFSVWDSEHFIVRECLAGAFFDEHRNVITGCRVLCGKPKNNPSIKSTQQDIHDRIMNSFRGAGMDNRY